MDYYILALVGMECQEAWIGLLQAMETLRAPPSLPSTWLGCHVLYICNIFIYICISGLTFSPLGTWFPSLFVYTVKYPLCSLLLVNPFFPVWIHKREQRGSCGPKP